MVKISEFQTKEVVNIQDGKRLGHIGDLDINISKGTIENMIIPGQGKFMGIIGKEDSLSIPWGDIVRIGSDVILVQMKDRIGNPSQSSAE